MLRRMAKRIWQVIQDEIANARARVWLKNRNLMWPRS